MNLKKIEKVLTSKSVENGPSSCEKRIYRAAVSQRLRNTALPYTSCAMLSNRLKKLTRWGCVLLEYLIVLQIVKKDPHFRLPEDSSALSQKAATFHAPKAVRSSPLTTILLL